jgi:hypothetical protein
VATFAAGTIAVSCVAETNVVVKLETAHLTTELLTKPVPFTVRVNCADPARHEFGLIVFIVWANELLAAANTTRNGRSFLIGKFG